MRNARSIFGARVIKPLVSVVALVLALGSVALAVTIQQNPRAFTEPKLLPTEEPLKLVAERHVAIPLVEMAFSPIAVDTVIRIDEVTVEGRRSVAIARAKPVVRASADKVVRAPCHDGEYRKLEAQRGVRLMCPGGSL